MVGYLMEISKQCESAIEEISPIKIRRAGRKWKGSETEKIRKEVRVGSGQQHKKATDGKPQ